MKAPLFGILAFAAYSVHDLVIKYLGGNYSPIQIAFFGALFSFPLIAVALIGDQTPGTLRPKHPWWLLLRSVSGTVSAGCAFYAFSSLPLADVYAVLFAAPLLITVLAIPMLGEKVGLHRGVAVVVGLTGVIVVLQPGSAEIGAGHIAALVSAVTAALNSIIIRKIGKEERSVVMILFPMMTNFVLMGALLPFVYKPFPLLDMGALTLVAGIVLLASFLLILAYRHGNAIIVAPMQYSQIIWAAIFSALLFDEYPSMNTYLGAGIVILSGLYILMRESKGNVSENRPVLETRTRAGLPVGIRIGPWLQIRKSGE